MSLVVLQVAKPRITLTHSVTQIMPPPSAAAIYRINRHVSQRVINIGYQFR